MFPEGDEETDNQKQQMSIKKTSASAMKKTRQREKKGESGGDWIMSGNESFC